MQFVSLEKKHVNVSFNFEVRHFLCCRMGIMLFSSVGGKLNELIPIKGFENVDWKVLIYFLCKMRTNSAFLSRA